MDAETSQEVPSIQASEDLRERVADLIERERQGEISSAEKSELDHYLQLEHLMRLAKADLESRHVEKMNAETERMKFHWEIWKHESHSFWKRVTIISFVLLILILFQLNAVKLDFPWIKIEIPEESKTWFQHWFCIPLYFSLLLMALFSFVDLMRNRVPEKIESIIHNNVINIGPFKRKIPLLGLGRWLYLIVFTIYFIAFSIGFFYITWKAR